MGSFEDRFYRFLPGSRWVFDSNFDGDKRKAVFTLMEDISNFTHIEFELFNPPDPGSTALLDYAWYVEDGFVVWGSYDSVWDESGLEKSPWWRIFKIGAAPGDTWETLPGVGRAKYVGLADVTVPAGIFLDTAHVALTDQDDKVHDFYYADGTGLVRWDTRSSRGNGGYHLREFQSGSS